MSNLTGVKALDLPNAVLFSTREDAMDDVMAIRFAVTAQLTIESDTCL